MEYLNTYLLKVFNQIKEPVIIMDAALSTKQYTNEVFEIFNDVEIDKLPFDEWLHLNREDIIKQMNIDEEFKVENKLLKTSKVVLYCDIQFSYLNEDKKEIFIILSRKLNVDTQVESEKEAILYKVASDLSDDVLFNLNLKTRIINYLGNGLKQFNRPDYLYDYPEPIIQQGHIYEEDLQIYLEMVENMYKGFSGSAIYRAITNKGEIMWYKSEYKILFDDNNEPIEAIGKIMNIHEQVELEDKINVDPLTGCLSKEAFELEVKNYLKNNDTEKQGILLMIDIDHFKAINDNLGHPFGDVVLEEVGSHLLSLFRKEDYVGRIGGDEFMVFIKDVPNDHIVSKKADEVLACLYNTYQGDNTSYTISGSVGIAKYPADGEDFKELYDKADSALNRAKKLGKNNYQYYNVDFENSLMENIDSYEMINRALAQVIDSNLLYDIFHLLFSGDSPVETINGALAILGLKFSVQRTYIFEVDEKDDNLYHNTFEWCENDVEPQIQLLQDVPAELLAQFFEDANSDGILFCNDLNKLRNEEARALMEQQDIKSFLHANIKIDDKVKYIIGFDDTLTKREWSPLEIGTLQHVSKMIVQCLTYKNALEKANRMIEENMNVFDSLNMFSYVVDTHTYELLYVNEAVRREEPNIELNIACYKAFRGADAPCETCPLNNINNDHNNKIRKTIYHDKLNMKILMNATKLSSYKERECMVVSCSDITNL